MTDINDTNDTKDINDTSNIGEWLKPKIRTGKPKNNNVVIDTNSNVPNTTFNGRNINFKINNSSYKTNTNTNINRSSSSNFNSNFNAKPKPIRVDYMIRDWCGSNVSTEEMCKDYEKIRNLVENTSDSVKYQQNINCVFDRLAQAWRYDVLDIFKNSKSYEIYNNHTMYKKNNGEGTPFHYLMFPIKSIYQNINDDRFEDLKKIFNTLIDYKFNIFKLRQVEETNETFLMTIIHNGEHAVIPEDFRIRFYKYITETFYNPDYFMLYLPFILNFGSDRNFIPDKIMYILQRYPEQGTKNLFEIMMSKTLKNKKSMDIENICDYIMSNPVEGMDYYDYLKKYNIDELRNNFIESLLTNSEIMINNYIEKKSIESNSNKIKQEDIYSKLMMVYGKFYSYGIKKDLILQKVVELIKSDLINASNPIECFIEHNKINLNNLSNEEKEFLKIFFDKFNNSNNTTKTSILNMISHLSNKFINNWADLEVFT